MVSDFSLIDAIESGIVKVPRVPVADDSMTGEQPTYRDLWPRIREELPKKGRKTEASTTAEPKLPDELEGALHSLYGNYEQAVSALGAEHELHAADGLTPPVFIVVCNNTNVSKLVFDYIAGWEKHAARRPAAYVPGQLPLFQQRGGRPLAGPARTRSWSIAQQLESGEAMSAEFKKIAPRGDRRVQGGVPHAASPAATPDEPDRRGSAARGDEHRRQAGQARRAGQVRRLASRC